MVKHVGLAGLLLCSVAFAQTEELENPGSIAAVQERAYRLNHELSVGFGILPLDAFTKGLYAQVGYTYHFTDYFAWNVGRGAYVYNVNTGLRDQLERDFAVLPTAFDEVQYFLGSDVWFKPFYGKLSVLNRAVVHFEVHLLAGLSILKFTQRFAPGINLGIGLRVFQNKYISYRLDVTDNVVIRERPLNVLTITASLALNFGATE